MGNPSYRSVILLISYSTSWENSIMSRFILAMTLHAKHCTESIWAKGLMQGSKCKNYKECQNEDENLTKLHTHHFTKNLLFKMRPGF